MGEFLSFSPAIGLDTFVFETGKSGGTTVQLHSRDSRSKKKVGSQARKKSGMQPGWSKPSNDSPKRKKATVNGGTGNITFLWQRTCTHTCGEKERE